ncbi:hypothetical protein EIN_135210 [Entamoeba invadens IP1]|uniref:Uncharacterized protein n=1 Tax=Entamoeba invadens IP1 TaxID=370355 RepID=A0A0A1TXC9_ENTIV|nr:hypothetical protein EIN_135210 [Entamoeba invadens IP1]ELP85937.1 hypothetical protein EIN_135210 [Entamoeba invadens IP1]|eukprot:XP_004185283.1 hypothetical protein EIN_135210 [Entamoeba invadens IP1]
MVENLDTKIEVWLLTSFHIIALIVLIILHVIYTIRCDKLNTRIHMTFVCMYLFLVCVVLTLIFDYIDLSVYEDNPTTTSTIWNVVAFLTSSFSHFFQFTYFYVALDVMNDYIDKALYNKPKLFNVCKRINQGCYVVLIVIINPSIGLFLYGYSIKSNALITDMFDCGLLWSYYCVLTLLYCGIMFVACTNAIILSYMTKDGVSFSGILLSPLKTMICVDTVAVLFMVQAAIRFVLYFYKLVSISTRSTTISSLSNELAPYVQIVVITCVHFPSIFILVFLLIPFTKPAKFNLKGY